MALARKLDTRLLAGQRHDRNASSNDEQSLNAPAHSCAERNDTEGSSGATDAATPKTNDGPRCTNPAGDGLPQGGSACRERN